MRRILPLALLAILAIAGCGSTETDTPAPPETRNIFGQMTVGLSPGDIGWYGPETTPCQPGGGYSDIHEGAQVVVTDAAAKTLAVGSLGPGMQDDTGAGKTCVFSFWVNDVPVGEKFYGVEVAHRGRLQYPAARITDPIILTLGD